jgi:AhpD family alkylhydroperoxidase
MPAIHDPETDRPFRKRIYTVGVAVRDVFRLGLRLPSIWRVWAGGEIDPTLREEIMLAVAQTNSCRYCAFVHHQWALTVGVDEPELALLTGMDPADFERDRWVALAWSRARAKSGFGPVAEELERDLTASYSSREREDLDTVVRVMTLANLTGNTFEAFLSRLRGAPVPGSRLPNEFVLASSYVLGMVPVALMLSVRRRAAPHQLMREFLRSPERSEPSVAS